MQKGKSALSAALRGNAPAAEEAPRQPKSDTFSFPCLGGAENDTVSELASNFQASVNMRGSLAGSAPTATLLSDGSVAADYELNPYRRRGGEERVPTPASSVDDKQRWQSLGKASLHSNCMGSSLLGSLPQGLSVNERTKILQSTPLSPTLNLLSSMPSDRVTSRSVEGRRLRRHVLRGAVIVFVTAGYSGKRFIYEKAKELGVRSVIIDGPDSWCQNMVKEGVVEQFVGIDFADADTIYDRCLAAIQKVKQDIGEVDGVCTFCEMAVPLVARLAEKLGLPGNSPQAVDAARDKHSTRAVMKREGLPTPRNMLISEPEDVRKAAEEVGFPAVIKPIYGAASLGVVRVNSLEDLEATYVRVQKEMSGARIVAGALTQADEAETEGDAGSASSWIKTTLMLEEYLDGPEVDVDVIFSEGEAVYGAITDNWPTVEPYFNETGSNCPSVLPAAQQRELMDLAVASVHSLGFQMGVFHVELQYTTHGPRLIEVNCRMGGGPVRATNLLVWGVDLVEEQLLCSAGIPSRPPIAAKPLMYIAEYSVNAKSSGRVMNVDFCQEWENNPDVLYVRPLVAEGQKVTAVTDGMPTWVAEVMVKKPTIEEAIEFVTAIEQALVIPIQ